MVVTLGYASDSQTGAFGPLEVHGNFFEFQKPEGRGFPGGAVVKNPPANAGDTGSSPGPGRFHMPRSN